MNIPGPAPDAGVEPSGAPPEPRIALVMLTAIGDVVHTLPVVNSLRAAFPRMHLTWIIQPGGYGLVSSHPAVDEFILFHRRGGLRAFADLRRQVADRKFDIVLDLQVYLKAGLITRLLRAPRRIGFDRARAKDLNWLFTNESIAPRPRRHLQDELLEFVEHLGVEPRLEWGLGPTAAEIEQYRGLLAGVRRPIVAVVVGTSKPGKEWPAERYAELVDRLSRKGMTTMLVGGRSDRELSTAGRIRQMASSPPLDMLEWDLRKLVYLIDNADVLVSPDTGPLHIGVALGTPSVALMGYTNPRRVGPYRRFPDLLVDAFGDPGEAYPASARYREGRMGRIGVDEVVEKVATAIARYPRGWATGQASP